MNDFQGCKGSVVQFQKTKDPHSSYQDDEGFFLATCRAKINLTKFHLEDLSLPTNIPYSCSFPKKKMREKNTDLASPAIIENKWQFYLWYLFSLFLPWKLKKIIQINNRRAHGRYQPSKSLAPSWVSSTGFAKFYTRTYWNLAQIYQLHLEYSMFCSMRCFFLAVKLANLL